MAINTDNLETVLNTKIASATSSTPEKDLLIISKSVEALDNSMALKPEDIGVTVQAYDANAATTSDVTTAVAALVASAPATLDTLKELSEALGDDPNHVTTMTTLINGKVDDAQVLTDVPVSAVFTDTVYSKPSAEPITYITGLQTALDGKQASGSYEPADADISKTDVAETRSAPINMADNVLQRPEIKDYSETKVAMGANDVDLSSGNVFTKTISGATTLTFSNPPASGKAGAFTLIVTLSGSPTITWPSSVKWAGGTAPTLTSAGTDIFTFMTTNGGTTWYGFTAGQDLT